MSEPNTNGTPPPPSPAVTTAKFAGAAGWELVSASAVKLLATLAARGPGQATATELARWTGLSPRTIGGALGELHALRWAHIEAERGVGYRWQLREPPREIAPEAVALYRAAIARAAARLDAKRAKIDLAAGPDREDQLIAQRDQLLAERAELAARVDRIGALLA